MTSWPRTSVVAALEIINSVIRYVVVVVVITAVDIRYLCERRARGGMKKN